MSMFVCDRLYFYDEYMPLESVRVITESFQCGCVSFTCKLYRQYKKLSLEKIVKKWKKLQNIGLFCKIYARDCEKMRCFIRNPLRSLLMKIGGFAARPKQASDVEKAAVSATFSTIFNLSGHSISFRKSTYETSRWSKLILLCISPVTRRVHPGLPD